MLTVLADSARPWWEDPQGLAGVIFTVAVAIAIVIGAFRW